MNYDWDEVYREAQGSAFQSGKKRFYDSKVYNISFTDNDGKFLVKGNIDGHSKYSPSVSFDEQGGLYDYLCDCNVFSREGGPCKHIVALSLTYEDKFPSRIVADAKTTKAKTDAVALTLSTEYSKKKHRRFSPMEEQKAEITPVLIYREGAGFSIRFNIGRAKRYVLKDISDFVSAYASGAYRRYGTELEIELHAGNFSADSNKLIDFMTACYREKTQAGLFNQHRDELSLLANDVDEFIAMYEGRVISFDDGYFRDGIRMLTTGQNSIPCSIILNRCDGGFYIGTDFCAFKTAEGKAFSYIITDSRIYKVSHEFISAVMPLLKTLNTHGKIFVTEADMSLFYNNVLARVSNFISLNDGGNDLSVYEAAPFVAHLYLDAVSGNKIEAKLSTSYDDEMIDIFDDNANIDTVRDWEAERALRELLMIYFPSAPNLTLVSEADIYGLMQSGLGQLFNYADIFLSDKVKKMKVKRPPRIKVGVRLESNLLNMDLQADDFTPSELNDILAAYKEKRNYVRLADGSFVDLNDQSLKVLSEIYDATGANSNGFTLPKYYAPFLDLEFKEGFFNLERNAEFKQLINSLKNANDLDIAVPESLKTTMRNYQKTGFRWLKTLTHYGFGGILADDMGLGKSLQVIAMLQESKGRSIIVCPTTLILNWMGEFSKFAPHINTVAVTGNQSERSQILDAISKDDVVIITSYELIRRDESLYEDMNFEYAIIDEAQYIKNPDTKNARSVKSLKAKNRFALTGTPIENSLAELWSIFDFVMPGYLLSYSDFKQKYEIDIAHGDEQATNKLKKLVRPFIMRRLKSGVLTELPKKVEQVILSPLENEQKQLYAANLSLIKDSIYKAGENVNRVTVLSMLTKLRQICCEPSLLYADYFGNSAKLETCMELISSAIDGNHKILLFSQFTSMLEIIRKKLEQNGISFYVLTGETTKTERMRLVNKFNSDDTSVFLISLKAGGTGLNLTGADTVIHYDPWWNESVMNQATDRAYRIGQEKSVQVYKLILKDSIEQRIMALQEKKSALSSLFTAESGGLGKNFSYNEILEILNM